jgi:protein-disulfide isomerase
MVFQFTFLGFEKAISTDSLYNDSNLRKLNRDIIAGLKLGVSGTPSFVIEGKVYASHIPTDLLDRIISKVR